MSDATARTSVTSYFIEDREALLLVGDFDRLLRELELHALSCDLDYDPLAAQLLSDGVVCLALHLLTRPGDESVGWTVSIQKPALNLFFVGHAGRGTVAGRAFLSGVKQRADNIFVAQIERPGGGQHVSTVVVEGIDIFAMAEHYYEQSEQKFARFFHQGTTAALLQALPGGDRAWLRGLENGEVLALSGLPTTKRLCSRDVMFHCGCREDRVLDVVAGAYGHDVDDLFGDESSIEVQCPRCGARYEIARERFEVYLAAKRRTR